MTWRSKRFTNAAAANDIVRAERLIEGKGVPLHFRGAGAPVLSWLQSLPTLVLDASPSLLVTYASTLMMTGHHTAVEQKLQAAEAALAQRAPGAEPDDTTRDLVGRIASMRATVAVIQHDVDTIIAQSRRALLYLHPDNLPLRAAATYTLGYAYQLQGDRAAASRAYRRHREQYVVWGFHQHDSGDTLSELGTGSKQPAPSGGRDLQVCPPVGR
jgi:LuxR family maltose regulon positive regulatory protein